MSFLEEARQFYDSTKDLFYISSDVYRALGFGTRQHKNRVGSFFQYLAKKEFVIHLSYKPSQIPSNHLRQIRTWVWTPKARSELSNFNNEEE